MEVAVLHEEVVAPDAIGKVSATERRYMSREVLIEILQEEKKVWQQKSYDELLALIPKAVSTPVDYEIERYGVNCNVEIDLLEITEEYLRVNIDILGDSTLKKVLGIFRVGMLPSDGWYVYRDGRVTSSLE